MAKLQAGMKMPDFHFDTAEKQSIDFRNELQKAPKTALVFLRYYDCTFCQMDMHDYEIHYEEITASKGQFFVVLQSNPDRIRQQLAQHPLPYQIICDPEAKLYKQFEITASADMKDIVGPHTMLKAARAKKEGYTHGQYEGIETQLPATFIIAQDDTILSAYYAKHVDESATAEYLKNALQ